MNEEKLNLSGMNLYLKEHTEETRKLRRTIVFLFSISLVLVFLALVYIQYYHVIAYPVQQLREKASKCGGLK